MIVSLAPQFMRRFKKLDPQLKTEAREKISLFATDPQNPLLHAHALTGRLKGLYSFSVNYKTRVIYQPLNDTEVVLLAIGSHDIYK